MSKEKYRKDEDETTKFISTSEFGYHDILHCWNWYIVNLTLIFDMREGNNRGLDMKFCVKKTL